MRPAHQTIQVNAADIIFCQNDHVVGGKLHNGMGIHGAQAVELIQIFDITIPEHLYKGRKDLCRGFCIIHGPVMIFQ